MENFDTIIKQFVGQIIEPVVISLKTGKETKAPPMYVIEPPRIENNVERIPGTRMYREIITPIGIFQTAKEAAKEFNTSIPNIHGRCKRESGGFKYGKTLR